jgi:hypothetical protein
VKPWPKAEDYGFADEEEEPGCLEEAYERARADAAMDRLRVAVEAICYALQPPNHPLAQNVEGKLRNALATIGELPDVREG